MQGNKNLIRQLPICDRVAVLYCLDSCVSFIFSYDGPVKYLGIDYGSKKIGLAVSDDGGTIAFPKEVIPTTKDIANVLSSKIDEYGVDEVVIGLSIDSEGNENAVMEEVRDIVGQLSFTAGVPIHLQQEAFTSMEARRDPGFGGFDKRNPANTRGKRAQKQVVDDSAAALLLQRFLDKQS